MIKKKKKKKINYLDFWWGGGGVDSQVDFRFSRWVLEPNHRERRRIIVLASLGYCYHPDVLMCQ